MQIRVNRRNFDGKVFLSNIEKWDQNFEIYIGRTKLQKGAKSRD